MRSLFRAAHRERVAPVRIICLPGAFHSPEDFIAAGFDAEVGARGLAIDLQFIDAELADLRDRRIRDELRRHAVCPARAAGCQSVWMTGISLGGFMTLDYADTHRADLDGLCLLAPYLGSRIVTGEIARARGLAAWQPGELAESDEERRIWRYVQRRTTDSPPLHLGFGVTDRFIQAHRLMAAVLPPATVDVVAGGHDWHTFTVLWQNFLDARFK